jgi:sugar lactone lactonase YvrE
MSRVVASVPRHAAIGGNDGVLAWTSGEDVLIQRDEGRAVLDLRDQARFIASNGDATYWVSAETGRLRRITAQQAEPVTLAELPLSASGLAVAGDSVYWSLYSTGEVRKYINGQIEVVASGLDMPMGLTVDGGMLLVGVATGIAAIDRTSGEVKRLSFEALAPIAVASGNGAVAWVEAGGRVMAASRGGSTQVLADHGRPTQVAIYRRDVLWVDASDGTVRRTTLEQE